MYYDDDDDYYPSRDTYIPGEVSRGVSISSSYTMPEEVQNFLLFLYKSIQEKKVHEIQNLYENGFVQLTESYFKEMNWPDEHEVAPLFTGRPMSNEFMVLYKELYYRHVYAKTVPTIEQRFESYYNYCALFNLLVSAQTPVNLDLPHQWLWDIIDEFIYQFQSYSLFRMRAGTGGKNESTVNKMRDKPEIWNVHSVLNVLHSLVEKSQINQQLKEFNARRDPKDIADSFGKTNLYKMLGYFSLIGLLRLHSLLGDYFQAINVLEHIDIHKTGLHNPSIARVLACQMATFYYVGFAYLMMRRYSDAIRTFTNILVYLQRTQRMYHHVRTFQQDLIEKQTDQMYVLLNICLVLHPQRIDESIASVLTEKYSESTMKMQRGDLEEFENVFRYACPKFLSPVAGIYDFDIVSGPGSRVEPWKQQLRVFLDEVCQHLPILIIRSYLKLYTTMPISKLTTLLDVDAETLKTQLLAYKHKMKAMAWTEGSSSLEGEFQSGSDVDFFIDGEMIHVADTKVARRYGDYFIRQIHKFEDLYRAVSLMRKDPVVVKK